MNRQKSLPLGATRVPPPLVAQSGRQVEKPELKKLQPKAKEETEKAHKNNYPIIWQH